MKQIDQSTIGVFAGFPPEHNAHIIEAVFNVRALQALRARDIVGMSASANRPPVQMLDEDLERYHAKDILLPLPYPHIPIANVHDAIDGYAIQPEPIRQLLEELGIDVVFLTYHPLCGSRLIEAIKETRKKVLLLAKIALVPEGQSTIFSDYHRDYDRSLANADRIIALQNNDARLIARQYPQTTNKIDIVHKFVDEEFLAAAKQRVPKILEKLGIEEFVEDGKKIVGCFGRVDPEKNVLLMAGDIWPRVERECPDARLLMLGTGTQSPELHTVIDGMQNVRLVEKLVPYIDLLALLSHIDVLAFPSGTDYTPRVPMDALLMGSRVVACDLNFNDVFRPYADLVPVTEFQQYRPYGYNDNARLLSNYDYQLSYGVPKPDAFAKALIRQLHEPGGVDLPSGLFTTGGFKHEFLIAFHKLGNADSDHHSSPLVL